MKIIESSIHSIDVNGNGIRRREKQNEFDEIIKNIIVTNDLEKHMKSYKSKEKSDVTDEILNCMKLFLNGDREEAFLVTSNNISKKLLQVEEIVQERNNKTHKQQLQKGSIVQTLILNNNQEFEYFIAKIEHSEFVSEADFIRRIGFENGKTNVWKSCKFFIHITDDGDIIINNANVYVNNNAVYWTDSFLELEEMTTDAVNTANAFKSVESMLIKMLKKNYTADFHIMRNNFITYMGTGRRKINYYDMIDDVFEEYDPVIASFEVLKSVKKRLEELPEKTNCKFETQFTAVPEEIKARRYNKFNVNNGIELIINKNGAVQNIEKTISSCIEDGIKYIKIETNDEEVYNAFLRK